MAYPSLDDLVVQFQAGSAVLVIVEGESLAGDAWVYGDNWFADRALEIAFAPQGSWKDVIAGVGWLRQRLAGRPVFGVIDRDAAPDDRLDELVPQGVFRLPYYSVENLLLDPECWFQVFRLVMRVRSGLPAGWQSPDEVAARVLEAYRACFDATAFNRVIWKVKDAHPGLPDAPPYIRSEQDSRIGHAGAVLKDWGDRSGHAENLGDVFLSERSFLEGLPDGELPCWVDGKMVQKQLLRAFMQTVPSLPSRSPIDWVNQYLDKCPDPPPGAVQLLDRILDAAATYP